jgi:phosphatidylserine/phosphatidylglycerophosphate/cardiolipin synthase-like enzyme
MRLVAVPLLIGLFWTTFASFEFSPAARAGIEVYYAPEDAPLDRLVQLYRQAKHHIYVSVYGLSALSMVKALIEAKKRGIDIRIITDGGRLGDPKQRRALETLRLAGIPIKISRHDGLMHLKQVVIDEDLNVSGSINHTTSGNKYNDERLDVITDARVTARARQKFLSMWKDPDRYADWK